ncbi:thioredoxin fold domain-containing protein [Vibrio hannami]|uniref:thioredoxin fold domain-containing protein n=1 Tax=Vibrio hannami TaxID=2717094 RepID=UPI002410096C|nr:thioredoxin fold domain-containing protein [Vibrio hannami]MDG3089022.1 thioredoxin fold domain-containing protein [Vibrio hannami]
MSVLRRLLFVVSPFLVVACTEAEEPNIAQGSETEQVVEVVSAAIPGVDEESIKKHFEGVGVEVKSIEETAIAGLVQVSTTGGVVYADPKGEHFISGTFFSFDENGRPVDVLAEKQAPLNAAKIEKFADDMIVYKAEDEKYVVTVFTDTTCTYCVRLHSQIQGYNDLGITVRYLAYPRQGPNGSVAEQMAKIWCSADPAKEMHSVKLENKFATEVEDYAQCQQKISDQYYLGQQLGITGTPAIFLPDGKLVAGYMPPAGLYQRLNQM